MRKALYIISLILITLTGCKKEKVQENDAPAICGEWKSTGTPALYLSFTDNGRFELYQHLKDGNYELYRGTYVYEDGILSGTYNDGEAFASTYVVSIHDKFMVLTSEDGHVTEFSACDIPDVIKDNCIAY